MNIKYSDENDNLTAEIRSIIECAADIAADRELGEGLAALDIKAEDAALELGVTITDEEEIRELNRDYRGIDKITDVLSFPQFNDKNELLESIRGGDKAAETLIGDVIICYEQAMRQADEYGTGATREMVYLFVHSLMHLFGYDHEDEEERKDMRAREEAVLSLTKGL